ncbi:MAG: hypothetical protein M3R61_02905 [Chloroflexota bacterium]|nr:hypothetical protein [Chloroflexota bacterium]
MGRPPKHADFFRVWTPEMAYVLGYWWADGCMRIKSNTGAHEFEIASNDREHLETVAQAIGGNYSLRKVSEASQCYKISFCSKEMYQDIQAHGGTPRKSRTIGFPYVPSELLPHFVRGVVDGDGTLAWNGDRPVLHIYSGSQQFLFDIATAIERATGMYAPNVNANRALWYIKWSTVRAKSLASWLYFDNPGIALGRKSAIATKFLGWPLNRHLKKG